MHAVISQYVVIALKMRAIPHVGITLNTLLIQYMQIEQTNATVLPCLHTNYAHRT